MEDWNLGLVLELLLITQDNGGIHSEDYPDTREQISLLDEGVKALKLLWSKPEVRLVGNISKLMELN